MPTGTSPGDSWNALRARLARPLDPAGLAAFRILLGLVLFFGAVRFVAKGWVQELYVAPKFHFTYQGFSWAQPWPEPWMTIHMVALAAAALALCLGIWARWAAALYFALFTYAELIEKSAYLNHYYLVSLLTFLLAIVPTDRALALLPERGAGANIFGHQFLFRAQIAIVYTYAGLAKLNGDWILRSEPIHTWLRSHGELPLIGPFLGEMWPAQAMSAFGLVFDLTAPWLLLHRRTRPWALGLALTFHVAISVLFPVGIFSFVMLASLSVLLPPSWPRRWLKPGPTIWAEPGAPPSPSRALAPLIALYLVIQAALPARFLLYPGPVNWTEEGFRFSWRVMLIEKAGRIDFHVHAPSTGQHWLVLPRDELTPLQTRMMSTQADMILEYSRHLAQRFSRVGGAPVHVWADAWLAYNGRPSQRWIDCRRDLAQTTPPPRVADVVLPLHARANRRRPLHEGPPCSWVQTESRSLPSNRARVRGKTEKAYEPSASSHQRSGSR